MNPSLSFLAATKETCTNLIHRCGPVGAAWLGGFAAIPAAIIIGTSTLPLVCTGMAILSSACLTALALSSAKEKFTNTSPHFLAGSLALTTALTAGTAFFGETSFSEKEIQTILTNYATAMEGDIPQEETFPLPSDATVSISYAITHERTATGLNYIKDAITTDTNSAQDCLPIIAKTDGTITHPSRYLRNKICTTLFQGLSFKKTCHTMVNGS